MASSTFILAVFVSLVSLTYQTYKSGRSESWCSDKSQGICSFDEVAKEIICDHITSPDKLEAILAKKYASGGLNSVVIKNSQLSHLPLLENKVTNRITLKLEESFLAFLSPPKFEKNGKKKKFFEQLNVKDFQLDGVLYVHSLNWKDVRCSTVKVENSRFLYLPDSINRVQNIGKLEVHHSSLRWVHKEAFKDIAEQMILIDLSHNNIETIDPGTFHNMGAEINLAYNNLKSFSFDAFAYSSEQKVTSLDLSYNNMTELHPSGENKRLIEGLDFNGNKLDCNCKYKWLMTQAKEVKGTCFASDVEKGLAEFLKKCPQTV